MDQFARIVIGYHGCTEKFARDVLMGVNPIANWQPSTNEWDWLGHGIIAVRNPSCILGVFRPNLTL